MAMFMAVRRNNKQKVFKKRRLADDDYSYTALYRFSRESVKWMAGYFLPENNEKRGGAMSNIQKMQTFLRYVGDPGFQVGVGEDVGIHQSTVSRTVLQVSRSVLRKSHEWIKFPETEEEMFEAKNEWRRKYNFPSVIGAVDCTHVLILKPSNQGDEYINRKGLASFNVQVTCNANEYITSIDCRWASSVHDSRIWRNSITHNIMRENPAGAILLGDGGYGITPWLMTPYRDPATHIERKYNKVHAQERFIIERVFGQVKRRFPILQSKIRMKTNRIPKIIGACFILHNIAKHLKEPDFPDHPDLDADVFVSIRDEVDNETLKVRGELRRDEIANFIYQTCRRL